MKRGLIFCLVIAIISISFTSAQENCTPDYICTSWSECTGNYKIRSCVDQNLCINVTIDYPEKRECGSPSCIPIWDCGEWEPEVCPENEVQTTTCVDLNDCNSISGKPAEVKNCDHKETVAWLFYPAVATIICIIIITGLLIYEIKKKHKRKNHRKKNHTSHYR